MEIPGEGPEPDDMAGDLGTVVERIVAMARTLNTAHTMSRSASGVLATLDLHGPLRLTALAVREGVTQPAMTQLVSRLQAAGLITREADPDDGRVVRIVITTAGRALMATRRAERTSRLSALLSQLSPGQRATIAGAMPALLALAEANSSAPVRT